MTRWRGTQHDPRCSDLISVIGVLKINRVRRLARPLVIAGSIAIFSFGCAARQPLAPTSSLRPAYDVWVNNSTPLSLVVRVNDEQVDTVGPMVQMSISASSLPALPWTVEVDAANGRAILSFPVEADSVSAGSGLATAEVLHGAGQFVDLSCGRIDAWVGPPLLGPPPPPSVPPCDPLES